MAQCRTPRSMEYSFCNCRVCLACLSNDTRKIRLILSSGSGEIIWSTTISPSQCIQQERYLLTPMIYLPKQNPTAASKPRPTIVIKAMIEINNAAEKKGAILLAPFSKNRMPVPRAESQLVFVSFPCKTNLPSSGSCKSLHVDRVIMLSFSVT